MEAYLDNAATTKVDNKIIKKINLTLTKYYGNPSSLHKKGQEAKLLLENSRKLIAKSINAYSEEIYFTSSGTESNNLAIRSLLSNTKNKHIITTKIEHPSILNLCKELEREGYKVTYLAVDNEGFIDLKELKDSIKKDTALVSIIHANNEIGTIQDIKEISKLCKSVLLHIDAVQSYKKIILDVKKLNISSLTISSHKIHGPKGSSALYLKNNLKLKPLIFGGSQESSLKPGTENVPSIVGFGLASKLEIKDVSKLKNYFILKLLKEIKDIKIISPQKSLSNIISVAFEGVESHTLLNHLNLKNIYASTGSACSSNQLEPSHVLKAINLEKQYLHSVIRFSLSKYTTKQEIDYTIKNLKTIVHSLRGLNDIN